MKKTILLTILLVILSSMARAQPYLSVFGTDSTRWEIWREHSSFDYYSFTTENIDTLINSKIYKEIKEKKNDEFFSNLYMREDTATGELWVYEPNSSKEHLIMDLTLNVGDSFFLPNWTKEVNYTNIDTVLVVDSVFIKNGKKHILFKTDLMIGSFYPWVKMQFIEGVGPNAGLRYLTEEDWLSYNWVTNNLLLCKFSNNLRTYHDSINSTEYCTLIVIGIEEHDKISISVYPNPASSSLTVELPSVLRGKLSVYNLRGNKLYTAQISDKKTVNLSVVGYKPGIYTIIFEAINTVFNQTFIKE